MKSNFSACLARVLTHEGGNDDDPRDPGGRTSRGITQGVWDMWRAKRASLPVDVWNAPQGEVNAIYLARYWTPLRCDDLPPGLDYAVFDFGVNSGIGRSAKFLQKILGVGQDGEIGPITLAAASEADPIRVISRLCDDRLTFLKGLNLWGTYGKGWSNRVAGVRSAALQMAASAPKPQTSFISELLRAIAEIFRAIFRKPAPKPPAVPFWVPIARKEIGLKETPGPTSTPRIIELRYIAGCSLTGDDGAVAWCKVFVNAVFVMAYLPIVRDWMARSIERDPNFVKLDGPAYGAVVSFWRNSKASGLGHIGFYVGQTLTKVRVLGGNQSDAVSEAWFSLDRVVGYYWPRSVPLPKVGRISVSDDGLPIASAV